MGQLRCYPVAWLVAAAVPWMLSRFLPSALSRESILEANMSASLFLPSARLHQRCCRPQRRPHPSSSLRPAGGGGAPSPAVARHASSSAALLLHSGSRRGGRTAARPTGRVASAVESAWAALEQIRRRQWPRWQTPLLPTAVAAAAAAAAWMAACVLLLLPLLQRLGLLSRPVLLHLETVNGFATCRCRVAARRLTQKDYRTPGLA